MVTQCIRLSSPGFMLISSADSSSPNDDTEEVKVGVDKADFEELLAEFREQLRSDRKKILAEIKLDFGWSEDR